MSAFSVLLLAVSAVSAQPVERLRAAAAEVAVQASSAVAGSSVAVHPAAGASERGAVFDAALRGELLKAGATVMEPEGAADFELKPVLTRADGRWLLSAALWRRSTRVLVAAFDRDIPEEAVPAPAPAPAAEPSRPRTEPRREREEVPPSLWLRGGHGFGRGKNDWAAAAAYRFRKELWEANLEGGSFERRTNPEYISTGAGGVFVTETFIARTDYVQAGATRLKRLEASPSTYIRGGAALRLMMIRQHHNRAGVGGSVSTHDAMRVVPVLALGLSHEVWRDIELSVRGELSPSVHTVSSLSAGGFAAVALAGVRLPYRFGR